MSSQREWFRDGVLARADELGLTSDALIGAAGGPSTSTMTKIRALATDPRGDVLRKLDAALQWPAGSAHRLWRDGVAPHAGERPLLGDYTDVQLADELARRLRQREDGGHGGDTAATSTAGPRPAAVTTGPWPEQTAPPVPDDVAASAGHQGKGAAQQARDQQDEQGENS